MSSIGLAPSANVGGDFAMFEAIHGIAPAILARAMRLARDGVDFIKTDHFCTFDGEPGYSLGQGQ